MYVYGVCEFACVFVCGGMKINNMNNTNIPVIPSLLWYDNSMDLVSGDPPRLCRDWEGGRERDWEREREIERDWERERERERESKCGYVYVCVCVCVYIYIYIYVCVCVVCMCVCVIQNMEP
jgi:hypothetical protein